MDARKHRERGEQATGRANHGSELDARNRTTEPVTLEGVLARENLNAAWVQVQANDGAAGVDGLDIKQSRERIRKDWTKIEAALRSGRYEPAAVRAHSIPKANGGERVLGIPTVLDRVIQQAIHQQMSPAWEPEFSEYSYGFRPGRVTANRRLSPGAHADAGWPAGATTARDSARGTTVTAAGEHLPRSAGQTRPVVCALRR